MAKEFYGYFDSTAGDERDYNEADLSMGFRVMCDTGVATLAGGNLQVSPAVSGLRTQIGYGGAMVQGFPYTLIDDGGTVMTLTHTLVTSYPRIDRVVLRLELSSDARRITLAVISGAEAESPVPPDLTRDGATYEISLAQCRVRPGATAFQAGDITDERSNAALCGNIRAAKGTAEEALALANTANTTANTAKTNAAAVSTSLTSHTNNKSNPHGVTVAQINAWPVGSIFLSMSNTNPATWFGGTWVSMGGGRMLVGVNSGDTDFNAAGKYGGSKTVTLTAAQTPVHRHTYAGGLQGVYNLNAQNNAGMFKTSTDYNWAAQPGTMDTVGSGQPFNNMPPYLVVYMWQRTA